MKDIKEITDNVNSLSNDILNIDLEKEMGKYLDANDIEFSNQIKLFDFAKHFFELGLKAQKGE